MTVYTVDYFVYTIIFQMSNLICPLCPPGRTANLHLNLSRLLKHIELFHSHDPSFTITCGLDGCLRTFCNFKVFRNHAYALHGANTISINQRGNESGEGSDYNEVSTEDSADRSENTVCESGISLEQLQKLSGTFLLGTKEKYKLSQVALQGIIEGVTSLMQGRLCALHAQICDILSASRISMKEDIDSLY